LANSSKTRGLTPGSASAWIEKQATQAGAFKSAVVTRGGSESTRGAGDWAADWTATAGKLLYENDDEDELRGPGRSVRAPGD
jgi:hypothetical protein